MRSFIIRIWIALWVVMVVAAGPSGADIVLTADLDRAITPVTAEYVARVVREARETNARAIVFRLDTPGGLMESTRKIVAEMLNSDIPILVWIGPAGSRAASAGMFITYASHIAGMAHGTHLGAAHPVMLGGNDMGEIMKQKAENDAAAWARTIAEKRNRNIRFAEQAVRESISLTDQSAFDSGVIDIRADSIDSFLLSVAAETACLTGPGPRRIALSMKKLTMRKVELKTKEQFMSYLTDPNVIYVLILLALAGIYFEFSAPGIGIAGIVGVISLILAAYGLSILPVNFVGLFLLIGGIAIMILDIKVASHGILTAGGIVAMAIGGLMLFEDRAFQVSLQVILVVTAITAAFVIFVVSAAIRVFHTKVRVGSETLAGKRASVRAPLEPVGQIMMDGELWGAKTEDGSSAALGDEVEILRKEGVKLIVRKIFPNGKGSA